MQTPITLMAIACSALLLGACDKTPAEPPRPTAQPATMGPGTASAQIADTSVPSAISVFGSTNDTPKVDATAGRDNTPLTGGEAKAAMPVPGQNNDQSAPLAPSGPSGSSGSVAPAKSASST